MAPKIQWPLVLFSLLAGCGGCAFCFAGAADLLGEDAQVTLVATIVSLALVALGGVCSMLHLASPRNALWAARHVFSLSGISVELIMLGVASMLMVAYGALCLLGGDVVVRRAVGVMGAASGVGLAFATGHGYLISSKPTWNTKKLPLSYTGTALCAGGFAYLALAVIAGGDAAATGALVALCAACAACSVATTTAYLLHLGKDVARGHALLYWGGIVGCGMVAPVACVVAMLVGGSGPVAAAATFAGLACSALGALSLRMLMWIVGAGFLSLFSQAQESRGVILNC